jgi:hypothetical protein
MSPALAWFDVGTVLPMQGDWQTLFLHRKKI